MTSNRLEAFSDGVIAILITILVLEMKVPLGGEWENLKPLFPVFLAYILSFIYLGIYWNNHHHLWQAVEKVNGKILWANLHLLFWLSLLPFATGWMGENHFASLPIGLYGMVLLMASIAWYMLAAAVRKAEGEESKVARAYRNDNKTKLSMFLYLSAVVVSSYVPVISLIVYAAVAAFWFIPDKRIEKALSE